MEGETDI